jgi:manganese efflux pump family protein
MVKLLAFVLPLAVDSFAIAAMLGASGVSSAQRWRITALFVVFESGMPLVGLVQRLTRG